MKSGTNCYSFQALLEYEKYKMRSGELPFTDASLSDPASGNQVIFFLSFSSLDF